MGGYCNSLIDGNALGLSGALPCRPVDCISLRNGNALGQAVTMAHAYRVRLNEEIKARKKRLRVLRAEMQQDGAALEQLKREVAEFERQCGRIEKAKRCRVAMTTVAATAAALCRVDMAATDQVDIPAPRWSPNPTSKSPHLTSRFASCRTATSTTRPIGGVS